ncbi:MAG TPA: response regulator transcription factor [Rectinemataceae bacterium]|nr:response regulator transcription factor [Rectinemataceae bacterium]
MRRVLVIDDEPEIRRLLSISLEKKGFEVHEAPSAFEGMQAVQTVRPDIVLLDLGLPDMDGSAALAQLRSWSTIPVIILSVRDAESDIVSLLNSGADDYLCKPFRVEELLARMNVVLRRLMPDPREVVYECGELRVDLGERRVSLGDREVKLTPTEYAILALLARHGGRIVTHSQLLHELWGPLADSEAGSLRVHVSSLRKKIEPNPSQPVYLVTEPGIGYRLAGS